MRIYIIDDQILFREGLASLLKNQHDFDVIGEAEASDLIIELVIELKPDLVLLDPASSDGNCAKAIKSIVSHCPSTTIVILTNQELDELLLESIKAGANGYMLKNTPITKLIAALRAIERGEAAVSRANTTRIINEFRRMNHHPMPLPRGFEQLTEREAQIMYMLGKGATNLEIAESLYISVNTVKVHVHNILDKLSLSNRRQAGLLARNLMLTNSLKEVTEISGLENWSPKNIENN